MNHIVFDQQSVDITIEAGDNLTELALALEFVANNFLGRGVYSWQVSRSKLRKIGHCILNATTLVKSGPPIFSCVASLKTTVDNGIIPAKLKEKESFAFGLRSNEVVDGQHRIYSHKDTL